MSGGSSQRSTQSEGNYLPSTPIWLPKVSGRWHGSYLPALRISAGEKQLLGGLISMERRTLLIGAAALLTTLGAVLVFLYARGADTRAADRFDTTSVLVATSAIAPGETLAAA